MASLHAPAFPFSYDNPGVSADVRRELENTLGSIHQDGTRRLLDSLSGRDIPAEFEQVMSPYGLSSTDIADITTGHWLAMWCIIHNQPLPLEQPSVAALREQVVTVLSKRPAITEADNDARQAIGEAMVHETVLGLDIRQLIWDEGSAEDVRNLGENTHQNMLRRDLDLQAMRLTSQGFKRH